MNKFTDKYLDMVRQMCVIRHTEETLLDMFSQGLLRGTVHTCIGQEACAVGVVTALDKSKDILFSNHRGHGHYLSYSGDVYGLVAEIMGRSDGVCGGIGGSQHIHRDNYYSNGIQGASVPVVAGMALAEKRKKSKAIAAVFIGDGTFGEGVIYETFNISSCWELPMLVVVENNQYAQSTKTSDQHKGLLEDRARAFDYEVTVSDGMNLKSVYDAADKVVTEIRNNGRPQMLFLNTYRFSPHSKGDDFRDESEISKFQEFDPLKLAKEAIGKQCFNEIDQAAQLEVNQIISTLIAG